MKNKFNLKKHITATNIFMAILILVYILDCYLPFPDGYSGYNYWDENNSPAFNYIMGSCGGLLKNYMAMGAFLQPQGIYRNFTCMFLHGFLLHLIANLVGLYFIGNYTEKKFGTPLTCVMFVLIAFAETFITDPLYAVICPEDAEQIAGNISCGASGGIFGLIGMSLAALFFDLKSIKQINKTTLIVSAAYAVLTTYVVDLGWTTLCHNVSMILGLVAGTAIILPFYLLKKGKFAPENKVRENAESDCENKEIK